LCAKEVTRSASEQRVTVDNPRLRIRNGTATESNQSKAIKKNSEFLMIRVCGAFFYDQYAIELSLTSCFAISHFTITRVSKCEIMKQKALKKKIETKMFYGSGTPQIFYRHKLCRQQFVFACMISS
jgi:hypothetical protein